MEQEAGGMSKMQCQVFNASEKSSAQVDIVRVRIWPSNVQSNGSLNITKIRKTPFMLLIPTNPFHIAFALLRWQFSWLCNY